eukprot:TRINITY_DN40707_c0_g1_i1.p1 TRINITY_DN40707_c0_g1~~TRINITY_DN40707_c0_g1_i1.p1  ORF type:complete len:509 (-),score=49.79 TRINITY_DN40707_c0_g1_i1:66-1592(-)
MLAAFGGQPQPVQRVSRRATQRSYSAPAPREIVPPSPIRDIEPPITKDSTLKAHYQDEPVHFTRGRVRDKNSTVDKLPFDNPIERQQALQQGGYIAREEFIPFPCKKRAKEQEEVIFGKRALRNDAIEEDLAFVSSQRERLRNTQKYGASQRFNDSGKIITGEVTNPDRVADAEHHVLKVGGRPKKFGLHPTYTAARRTSGMAAEGTILAPRGEPRRNGIRVYNPVDTRDLLNFDSRINETVVPAGQPSSLPPFSPRRTAPATPRSPRQYEYKDPSTATLLKWPGEAATPLGSEVQRKVRKEQENSFHQKLIREGYPQTRDAHRNRGLRHIGTDDHITAVFDYEAPKPMRVEPRDFFTASRAAQPVAATGLATVSRPVPAPVLAAKPPLAARRQPAATQRGLRTGYAHATQSTADILCPSSQLDTSRSEGRARLRSQSQPPPPRNGDAQPSPQLSLRQHSPTVPAPTPQSAARQPPVLANDSPPRRSRSAPAPPAQRRLSGTSISLDF